MDDKVIILRDLTDEELLNLTDEESFKIQVNYNLNGVPYKNTIKGLLEEFDIKSDDLSDFILNFNVGRCNYANRTDNQIYISRHDSGLRDNIVINLDGSRDVPDIVVQIQVTDNFVHEEAYNEEGLLIYKT